MERGLVDADLGGHVYKKRIALGSRGKSSGARTLIVYRVAEIAFFVEASPRPNETTSALMSWRHGKRQPKHC